MRLRLSRRGRLARPPARRLSAPGVAQPALEPGGQPGERVVDDDEDQPTTKSVWIGLSRFCAIRLPRSQQLDVEAEERRQRGVLEDHDQLADQRRQHDPERLRQQDGASSPAARSSRSPRPPRRWPLGSDGDAGAQDLGDDHRVVERQPDHEVPQPVARRAARRRRCRARRSARQTKTIVMTTGRPRNSSMNADHRDRGARPSIIRAVPSSDPDDQREARSPARRRSASRPGPLPSSSQTSGNSSLDGSSSGPHSSQSNWPCVGEPAYDEVAQEPSSTSEAMTRADQGPAPGAGAGRVVEDRLVLIGRSPPSARGRPAGAPAAEGDDQVADGDPGEDRDGRRSPARWSGSCRR